MESFIIEDVNAARQVIDLLRFVFWKEPTKPLLQDFLQASIIEEENDIDRGLNLMNKAIRTNENQLDIYLETLAIEFTRLFLGPASPVAVPFASYYLSESKRLMTEETISVRKKYLDAGLASKYLHSVPDDHISTELEFLALLAQETTTFYESGELEKASQSYEIMNDFLVNHLAQWTPEFAELIIDNSEEDFFKGAALVLRGLIKSAQ